MRIMNQQHLETASSRWREKGSTEPGMIGSVSGPANTQVLRWRWVEHGRTNPINPYHFH